MNMGDARKQVMFDLEIQAAQIPCQQAAVSPKVHRAPDLVDGPVVFALRRAFEQRRKVGLLDAMGELKNKAQGDAERERGREEEQQDDPNGMDQ